jgi:CO dehydrogenase maturation factor
MRIAVMGKGGAGKTTVAAGLVRAISRDTSREMGPVLAVDGDLNVHLGGILDLPVRPLHPDAEEIARWLEPSLHEVSPVIGVTPPSGSGRFVRVTGDDPFLQRWATWSADRRTALLTAGTYEPADAGAHCYHVKLEVVQMVLHRTLDAAADWVVSDSTAGIDAVGTSLLFTSDLNLFVVEPSARSLAVYRDFATVAGHHGLRTLVVANKVADREDARFLREQVPAADLVGEIELSRAVRRVDRGDAEALEAFVDENAQLWDTLRGLATSTERDWDAYLARLRKVFADNCSWWYDAYYGRPLGDHVDGGFRYADVAERR